MLDAAGERLRMAQQVEDRAAPLDCLAHRRDLVIGCVESAF